MSYFVYKLIPPRPTFAQDLSEHEQAVMGQHVGFWTELAGAGTAIVFGPVADPAGDWGLAVMRADSIEEAYEITESDPAVTSGVAHREICAMPQAVLGAPAAVVAR